ncbi:desulfoferrodoxin family protein [Arcobacter sp. CECT 8985]|uniref:desulfoferrodoxin family protein n=1 Tax=Arcobacter sp. CECT 8985 TaxID=1935424 RepID=UPI00100C173E|nr:desulfoferrodoxin family protein [Arcobacter sp. CECT 8985]RXJ86603.1 twin-arginine translocation pathway signal protein [Arcobacter sp. CECT 8985]
MKRRDLLKLAGLLSFASATYAFGYDKKLVKNTNDMKVKDPTHPTDFEYKHLPEIKIGDKDKKGYSLVEVSIGQHGIIHPSTAKHWIYEIDLYVDGKEVSKVSLEPIESRGYLASRVKLDGVKEISATSRCTLHGNYTYSMKV